jgi:hypothetical protein
MCLLFIYLSIYLYIYFCVQAFAYVFYSVFFHMGEEFIWWSYTKAIKNINDLFLGIYIKGKPGLKDFEMNDIIFFTNANFLEFSIKVNLFVYFSQNYSYICQNTNKLD